MNYLRKFISFTALIITGVLLSCFTLSSISCLKEGISPAEVMIPLTTLWDIFLVGVICGFITTLFSSKDSELSKKKFWLWTILHYLIMNVIVFIFGYFFHWYELNLESAFMLAVSILFVYFFTSLFSYIQDKKLSDKINDKLKNYPD